MKIGLIPNPYTLSPTIKVYAISKNLLKVHRYANLLISCPKQTIWSPLASNHSPYEFLKEIGAMFHMIDTEHKLEGKYYGIEMKKLICSIKKFRPDSLVLIESFAISYIKKIMKTSLITISNIIDHLGFLERFKSFYELSDEVIFPFTKKWSGIPDDLQDIKDKFNFVGPILKRRSNELPSKEEIRRTLNIDEDAFVIFSTDYGKSHINGEKSGRIPEITFSALKKVKSEINKEIVLITSNVQRKIQPEESVKVINLPFTFNLERYMKASDVVVTKPGYQTISECVSVGTPTLLINFANDVERSYNVRKIVEAKAGISINDTKFNEKNVANSILKIFEKKIDTKKAYDLYINRERGVDITTDVILRWS